MSKLNYKTRGNSNPQGKPRVYFTCHPEDFAKYFETISEEILEKQNCAIYYYESCQETDVHTLELELSQMQLFVIPVTSKFLYQENLALDVHLKFAATHHIPVLPLMQESYLEEEFQKNVEIYSFLINMPRIQRRSAMKKS